MYDTIAACLLLTEHAGNWLTEMPRGLYQLEALEALSVAGNRITHLSSSIAQLTRLRLLDVSDNALRSLPKVLERMSGIVTLNVAGNDLKPPKAERRQQHGSRRGRREPTAATSRRKDPLVANGPLPTFVVSADPSTRVVYTSPILATPNGDLLYRPPLPPSPAKSGRRVRGLFRRKADRENDRTVTALTSTPPAPLRHHQNNDIINSSSTFSNRRSQSAVRDSAERRDAAAREPFPLSADEATRRRRGGRPAHRDDSLPTRHHQRPPLSDHRSRSVTDLRGDGAGRGGVTADDGWTTGTLRGSRLANVGRLAAAGIDLGQNEETSKAGGSWIDLGQNTSMSRAGGRWAAGGEDEVRSDESLFCWNEADNVDDDDDRCSDTVTVNEAVGDELSLGEDDFEFLPTNVQDSKLKRIADDLEALLNRQLLQPLIGDTLTPYDLHQYCAFLTHFLQLMEDSSLVGFSALVVLVLFSNKQYCRLKLAT